LPETAISEPASNDTDHRPVCAAAGNTVNEESATAIVMIRIFIADCSSGGPGVAPDRGLR
jgi:hypothetical protein